MNVFGDKFLMFCVFWGENLDENDINQNDETPNNKKPSLRNIETIALVILFCVIWIIPFLSTARAGGIGGFIYTAAGLMSSVVGAFILFFPLRWLIRLSLDGNSKTMPRMSIIIIFTILITYFVFNITPGYIKDMESVGYEYYNDHTEEFTNPSEGKIINIDSKALPGPYITYFKYTESNPPKKDRGGTIINFNNGWYFIGVFAPAWFTIYFLWKHETILSPRANMVKADKFSNVKPPYFWYIHTPATLFLLV